MERNFQDEGKAVVALVLAKMPLFPPCPWRLSLRGSSGVGQLSLEGYISSFEALQADNARENEALGSFSGSLYVSFGGEAADFTSVRSSKHSIHPCTLIPPPLPRYHVDLDAQRTILELNKNTPGSLRPNAPFTH